MSVWIVECMWAFFRLTECNGCIDLAAQASLRSSPCQPWGSRRSSWNSLGRASSLKRKSQSGERESLLSGEGRASSEEEDSDGGKSSRTGSGASLQYRAESLDLPELLQVPMLRPPGEHHDCNGKSFHLPPDYLHKNDPDFEEDAEEVSRQQLERQNVALHIIFQSLAHIFHQAK